MFCVADRSKFSSEKIDQFGQMAMLVARLVGPEYLPGSASDLVELFCKFACNNYNISDSELRPIGVGLYPTAALINHSCRPNCIAIFDGVDSVIRAIEPIQQNQEVRTVPIAKKTKYILLSSRPVVFSLTHTHAVGALLDYDLLY